MSRNAVAARHRYVEATVRRLVGLRSEQPLHTGGTACTEPETFSKQAAAIERRRRLLDRDAYGERQVGVFAREVGTGGIRQYLVDTFAGFAIAEAPQCEPHDSFGKYLAERPAMVGGPRHLYEVILEDQPCWWYFDLEYSTKLNPDVDPATAARAFLETLRSFCREVLGAPLDESSVLEMESSTEDKFSMHVVVKRLLAGPACLAGGPGGDGGGNAAAAAAPAPAAAAEGVGGGQHGGCEGPSSHLAFANNAQAGLLVRELIAFARARRELPDSLSRHLFVCGPQPSGPGGASAEADRELREVSVIDETVYSRNRCFRLIYNSKFGKSAALKIPHGSGKPREPPALRMLGTMASFVPEGTPLFRHPLVPPDFGHVALLSSRPRAPGGPRQSAGGHVSVQGVQSGLLRHLIETWDGVRWANEPKATPTGPTTVATCIQVGDDGRYLVVTLQNNRFCFCKGASHKSNAIYLVVDQDTCTFHQKCHDRGDCGPHYKSPPFEVPEYLCEDAEEREFLNSLPLLLPGPQARADDAAGEPAAKRARADPSG